MTSMGQKLFDQWQDQVKPRIQHIRNAYLAAATLEELLSDQEGRVQHWQDKVMEAGGDSGLVADAQDHLETARHAYKSLEETALTVGIQMQMVESELNKLADQRLTLRAMCTNLDVTLLGTNILESVYQTIGPDSAVYNSLNTARQAIGNLNSEVRAREELANFLADESFDS